MEIKINTIKLKLLACLSVLLIVAACTKQSTDSTLISEPVVQSYLIPGQVVTVKLYQQKQLTDTATYGPPITGIQVHISDGSKNVLLTETASGVYTYNDPTFLVVGKTYTLQFNYLTFSVSAQTVMPGVPANFAVTDTAIYIANATTTPNSAIDTLDRFTWSNPDSLNHVIVFKNLTGPDLPISRSFFRSNNTNINFEANTNRTSVFLITQNTLPYYARYQVILYRVNTEYINMIASNTNTATSQTLTNTYTNIVNGYGIFTAMQPAVQVIYITVYST